MVSKSHAKRRQDIKTKLMAAIAMLLVSSIMMVSSTYAWFTLSTAPEVKGINTAVGANGNLEMMLQPFNGNAEAVISGEGDSSSAQSVYASNTTWGNLVDLSISEYGLSNIVLNPAALNTISSADGLKIKDNPLKTPEYGADGRITALVEKTISGVYNATESKFLEDVTVPGVDGAGDTVVNNAKGVRAVGISSGMSDRQLAYRAAVAAASNAESLAKKTASTALNAKGAKLADIAIHKATGGEDSYKKSDLELLQSITVDLLGAEGSTGAVQYIEQALIKYALATEIAGTSDDESVNIINAYDEIKTLDDLKARYDEAGVTKNDGITTAIGELEDTIDNVTEAKNTLDAQIALDKSSYAWVDFSAALTKLADPGAMQVNGVPVDKINADWTYEDESTVPDGYYTAVDVPDAGLTPGYVYSQNTDGTYTKCSNISIVVSSVLGGNGLQLIIASGAGVFADIADFCGDYSADVKLQKLSYNGVSVTNLNAKMLTATDVTPVYLEQVSEDVPGFTAGEGGGTSDAISDFYGYIIDLAFRTNASGSNLQLQQEGVDRIYNGNTQNTQTLGAGAYMSFKTLSTTFKPDQVKSLMEDIRIVFFDTDNNLIKGYAKLDSGSAMNEGTNNEFLRMPIVMCNEDGVVLADEQTIMPLEQNKVHKLSVLVYLDGESVTNADVAADAVSSLTGTMNIQFSSSATLIPMEYTDLRQGNNAETPATPTAEEITVTGAENVKAYYVEVAEQKIIIVTGAAQGDTVTVDGEGTQYGEMGGKTGHYLAVGSKPTTVAVTVTPATP